MSKRRKPIPPRRYEETGKSRTPEYAVWRGMRQRCRDVHSKHYAEYGGRGISVSPEWESFATFLLDMGERPTPAHTIDRIDNNGNYEKGNCRWATMAVQIRNRRNTVMLTYAGQTKCQSDWAKLAGITHSALWYRLKKGWSIEAALTTPATKTCKRA